MERSAAPKCACFGNTSKILRARNQCDFSGLLSETVRLLRQHDDVRQRLQSRFRFIQVTSTGYQTAPRANRRVARRRRDNVLPSAMPTRAFTSGAAPARRDEAVHRNGRPRPGDVLSSSSASTTARPRRSSRLPTRSSATQRPHCGRIQAPPAPPVSPPAAPRCPTPEDEAEAVATSIGRAHAWTEARFRRSHLLRCERMSRSIESVRSPSARSPTSWSADGVLQRPP